MNHSGSYEMSEMFYNLFHHNTRVMVKPKLLNWKYITYRVCVESSKNRVRKSEANPHCYTLGTCF